MKKTIFLLSVTYTVLFLSPLLLTGCQALGEFFGGSPSYRGQESYNHTATQRYGTTAVTSSTHRATTHKTVNKRTTTSVPVEQPRIQSMTSAVPGTTSTNASTSTSSGNGTPVAPIMAPTATPTITPPAVTQ